MLDINRFKATDDTYGHPMADTALEMLGELIEVRQGPQDFSGRLGGQEFIVIANAGPGEGYGAFAGGDRFAYHGHDVGETFGITINIGIAEARGHNLGVSAQGPARNVGGGGNKARSALTPLPAQA